MSFVINTTVDKNQELLEAYKELYEADASSKDVFLISKKSRIAVDSFALGSCCFMGFSYNNFYPTFNFYLFLVISSGFFR